MAPNIYGKRFVAARNEPAWHAIITPLPTDRVLTAEEAVTLGHIDFRYAMAPAGFLLPDGQFVTVDHKQAVLREPTADSPEWDLLGYVSEGYRFMQNVDLARGLDAIAKETGWAFDTAGALGKGETVFMTLRTGRTSIFGDDLDTYLIVSDGKAAQRALQIAVARVRVVCQNTLMMSDTASSIKITIPHDRQVETEYGFWLGLIGQLQTAQDAADKQLEAMASVKITDKQAKAIIASAYPQKGKGQRAEQADRLAKLPGLSPDQAAAAQKIVARSREHHDFWQAKTEERRGAAFELYQRLNVGEEEGARGGRVVTAETLDAIRNTPYAVLQAVTELVDWGGPQAAHVAASNALFGDGAEIKGRAWGAALKVASKV